MEMEPMTNENPTKRPVRQLPKAKDIAKDIEEFTKDIEETLKINPEAHSPKVNKTRLSSFKYALAGFLHMIRYQQSAHMQIVVTVVVFALAAWAQVPRIELMIMVLAAGLVWTTEFLNTAIESAVNLTTIEYHPMARVAKDVASGATLVATVVSLIVGLTMLIPHVLDKL